MSRIAPGDLVMAVDAPPKGYRRVIFVDGLRPGMTGVALSFEALDANSLYPFPSVLVRWPHATMECYAFALRKIGPPPPGLLAQLRDREAA